MAQPFGRRFRFASGAGCWPIAKRHGFLFCIQRSSRAETYDPFFFRYDGFASRFEFESPSLRSNRIIDGFIPRMITVQLITKLIVLFFHFDLFILHLSLQYFTSSQTFSHFLRHANGFQTTIYFVGKFCFNITFIVKI
jgi:hypothetical protein